MNTKKIVIYHKADFDGVFCREIAKRFIPDAILIGWDYGDPEPDVSGADQIYILDLSVDSLMSHPGLVWIDHHKTAIDKYPGTIPGYRIDGVAACRLTWQWFLQQQRKALGMIWLLPDKTQFIDCLVLEPEAVRLAGQYDIWDKRDPNSELFQHGLRSEDLTSLVWDILLPPLHASPDQEASAAQKVSQLLEAGKAIQFSKHRENDSIIRSNGFTIQFEGLTFLACNAARYNSQLFSAGINPDHDGLLGFNWDGTKWKVSLYGVPGKPDVDLSEIAKKYGGGGHKQACGFTTGYLAFLDQPVQWNPYNKVVQDHRDGKVDIMATNLARRYRKLETPWTPEIADTESKQPPVY